ncbi:chaplin [Streptomyces sp. NPDC093982]|uniref:chaplin n=1 Tax=Streptomyces sp. NPDC093982 TaxID=3155077 RepID=UPI00342A05E7
MAAAVTGALSLYSTGAHADSPPEEAAGETPVLSGNTVQGPLNLAVNVCGTAINAIAADRWATNGICDTTSGESAIPPMSDEPRPNAASSPPEEAAGETLVLSGNTVQGPLNLAVNVCGTAINAIAADRWATNGICDTTSGDSQTSPPKHHRLTPPTTSSLLQPDWHTTPTASPTPAPPTTPTNSSLGNDRRITPPTSSPLIDTGALADTGTEAVLVATAAIDALLAGGVLLYRLRRVSYRR